VKVSEAVMAVLSTARTEGNALFITGGQLDRKLYESTNKVLEAAGGKWNRKQRAHLFAGDAAEAMDQVLLSGEITRPQDFGYFPTPAPVIDRLFDLADLKTNHLTLEPSAGTGAIALPMRDLLTDVDCVELLPKHVEALRKSMSLPMQITEGDFLAIEPQPKYDRVVMNPPFAKQADIRHVMHASRFLKRGGRLVSVMASGVKFRQDRTAESFRAFLEERDGTMEDLPPDSFKESGTSVNTVIVTLKAA
jgi:predicted RNA methylase